MNQLLDELNNAVRKIEDSEAIELRSDMGGPAMTFKTSDWVKPGRLDNGVNTTCESQYS